ncbi:MAG: pyruvate formate lyase family protein [Dehalococcoidia bacterium]|nr:pyruvate formate lyase family protein [Dehalococcoidia bacterium]
MTTQSCNSPRYSIKEPLNLSPRIQWLRDYYFQGNNRKWNNEFTGFTTGTPWDIQYQELNFYIVPETYTFFPTFTGAFQQASFKVDLPEGFWEWSLPERQAWFVREVMVYYLPHEVLPGDLIAGGRFNVQTSRCFNKKEAAEYSKAVYGKKGARAAEFWFHNHGYGNAGATSGHLIPDYPRILREGWKSVHEELNRKLSSLSQREYDSKKGHQIKAMLVAATMARDVAFEYSKVCAQLAENEADSARKNELVKMAEMLRRVPWEPAQNFWEAIQSLWITHMLVMSDENYPGPGVSFGRADQYLYPFWKKSLDEGMDREFGKELLKCFWIHCNYAYDAMIRTGGNQGITAGFGQLITISGMGKGGVDLSNDLTYGMLEVIDELSPLLEPKPNVRLHRRSPDRLLEKVIDMIASSQGSPFLLNFDERSIAGMLREARIAGVEKLINADNVFDYAPVGCLENTMCGNDRSGTVDINLNLLKAVEHALTGGYDMIPWVDPMTGKQEPIKRWGADTGDATKFRTWEEFWNAYVAQTRHLMERVAELYDRTDRMRAKYLRTPYLSCLVRGCADKAMDINEGGAELNFITVEAVTYATTVDSLLAIRHLVFDKKECSMQELIQALKDNWKGHEVLQARALNKTPKYGRDDDQADNHGKDVMDLWTGETWKYRTSVTGKHYRPGMLSWNYWVGDGFILPASPDGRPKGQFLSNAICPCAGADINGPTANVNSVGKVLGGKDPAGNGDWDGYLNVLPNGASHTMTFSPSLLRDPEHKSKFMAFLRSYAENGGSALQVNMIDADILRDAQTNPDSYRHLLVRVTGYNAYFTSIGRELQNEIIARESHCM